jgi:hypothetical protein
MYEALMLVGLFLNHHHTKDGPKGPRVASRLINQKECLFICFPFVNCLRLKFRQFYSPCFVADQSRYNP